MKKALVNAAIYVRISSDREATKLGVGRQEKDCKKFCEDQGWAVAAVYSDNDVSAADPSKKRPEYERMMREVRSGRVDAVAVYALDRLYRQPMELEQFVIDCKAVGMGAVGLVVGGVSDLSDPDALMLLRIKGSVAANEIDKMRTRIRRKKNEIAERGMPSGGKRAYGYDQHPGEPDTVNEVEAAHIQEAASRVLEGQSLKGIVTDWNERGIGAATGGRWSRVTLRNVLMRPRTAGLRQHGLDERGQPIIVGDAAWDKILDMETWEAVRAVLGDPARRPPPATEERPLLGILFCAACGHRLTTRRLGHSTKGYACRKDTGGCERISITAARVDEHVLSMVIPLADSPAFRQAVLSEEKDVQAEAKRLVTENARDQRQIDQMADDYADGVMTRAAWIRQTKRLQDRVNERTGQLSELRGSTTLDRFGGRVTEAWPSMSAEERRAVILSMVKKVRVLPAEKRGGPFDTRRVQVLWRWGKMAEAALGLWDAMTPEEQEEARLENKRLAEEIFDEVT